MICNDCMWISVRQEGSILKTVELCAVHSLTERVIRLLVCSHDELNCKDPMCLVTTLLQEYDNARKDSK